MYVILMVQRHVGRSDRLNEEDERGSTHSADVGRRRHQCKALSSRPRGVLLPALARMEIPSEESERDEQWKQMRMASASFVSSLVLRTS